MSSADVSPDLSDKPPPRRVATTAAALGLLALCMSTGLLPVYRDALQRYFGIGDARYGFLLSLAMVGGLVSVLPGGLLIDRRGPVAAIRVFLTGAALAFAGLALAGRSWGLAAAALALHGTMNRPLGIAVNALLVRLYPKNKRRVLSLNLVALSGGEFVYPALAEGLLVLSQRSESVSFGMVLHGPYALMAFVMLGGAMLFRPNLPVREAGAAPPLHPLRAFRFPWPAVALMVLAAAHGIADSVIYFWWPRFLGSEVFPGAHAVRPGFLLSGYAIGYVTSRLGLAFLPENRWRRRLMVLPGLAGGTVLIGAILSRNYMVAGLGHVLAGFLWSAEFPVFIARLADETGERFASALAAGQMLAAAGTAGGLWAMGLLVGALPEDRMWQAMLLPAMMFPLIGVCGGLWAWHARKTQVEETRR